ncbi:MAG: hypothetical protein KJO78_12310 [Alphaproteobacteria bacterium]|nr:hypothetical protein [Alphaproteobacteria bacterium]
MQAIVWIGAGITVLGVAMLGWCAVSAARARSAGLDDDALRARLQKIVALNLGGLAVSGIGLMVVIVALFLS